jgi:hypothetical protein
VVLGGATKVSGADIAGTPEARLDPHHFVLRRRIEPINGVSDGTPVAAPDFSLANGANLAQRLYQQEDSADGSSQLYASVAAISQFTFRIDACQPLVPDAVGEDLALRPDEILITRSGTPGIAWSAAQSPADLVVIPSGFLIRVRLLDENLLSGYVAGILNHPVWRVWTASLATGKRQRNLSQDHLRQVRIPSASLDIQRAIADSQKRAIEDVERIVTEDIDLREVADGVLAKSVELPTYRWEFPSVTSDHVSLEMAASRSRTLRLDPSFHRSGLRAIADSVDASETVELSSLLSNGIVKSGQPTILEAGDIGGGRVIASISLQGGRVVEELTKPTTEDQIETAGTRLVQENDLLVAMDGYSYGKAAVFSGTYDAVTDSHVGVLRLHGDRGTLGGALACFLASSYGRSQLEIALSGSSAYQLSKDDLSAVRVPTAIVAEAPSIAADFLEAVGEYVPLTQRVRDRICACSAEISAMLLEAPETDESVKLALAKFPEKEDLMSLLAELRPEMF